MKRPRDEKPDILYEEQRLAAVASDEARIDDEYLEDISRVQKDIVSKFI